MRVTSYRRLMHRPKLAALLAGVASKEERNHAMAQAHIKYGYTLAEIGKMVGLHYATISRIVKAPE